MHGRLSPLLYISLLASLTSYASELSPSENYILTGPEPALLQDEIGEIGGKIVRPLRYHSGFVVALKKTQVDSMRILISLRQTVREFGTHHATRIDSPAFEILERDGDVHLVDPQASTIFVDDPLLTVQQITPWGVKAVHAPEVFPKARGNSVIVCVVDSGVQSDHPDLVGAVVGGENTIHRQNLVDGSTTSYEDDYGHGTHVCGTIAARDNGIGVVGIAPESKLYVVKALDHHGSGTFSSLAEGIRACMAHGAQVINLSLGYKDDTEIVRRAVQDALSAGITVVAASGNSKRGVEFPARFPGVIGVASMAKDGRISYFSSRGPEISWIAPGEAILSTYRGSRYAELYGTSQAAPHVSGVAALLLGAGVPMHEVRSHLRGDDLGLDSDEQGKGCVDAVRSLSAPRD